MKYISDWTEIGNLLTALWEKNEFHGKFYFFHESIRNPLSQIIPRAETIKKISLFIVRRKATFICVFTEEGNLYYWKADANRVLDIDEFELCGKRPKKIRWLYVAEGEECEAPD